MMSLAAAGMMTLVANAQSGTKEQSIQKKNDGKPAVSDQNKKDTPKTVVKEIPNKKPKASHVKPVIKKTDPAPKKK